MGLATRRPGSRRLGSTIPWAHAGKAQTTILEPTDVPPEIGPRAGLGWGCTAFGCPSATRMMTLLTLRWLRSIDRRDRADLNTRPDSRPSPDSTHDTRHHSAIVARSTFSPPGSKPTLPFLRVRPTHRCLQPGEEVDQLSRFGGISSWMSISMHNHGEVRDLGCQRVATRMLFAICASHDRQELPLRRCETEAHVSGHCASYTSQECFAVRQ
jgi:hypothetical protein